jgi:hypothetical protein
VPGTSDLSQNGFKKNETRPDLIIYNKNPDSKILIIESKDNIEKLIDASNDNNQLKKTCKVFFNIKNKVNNLIKNTNDKDLLNSIDSINYIPGYVVSDKKDLSKKITELKKLHFKFINKSIFPYFIIIIIKKTGFDLSTEAQIISYKQNDKTRELEEFFKTGI